MGDRKQQRREHVKARLREAMGELAPQRCFVDLKVDEVAAAAGLSCSAFYFYYPDMKALLIDSASRVSEELLQRAAIWWQGEGDPRELIETALRGNAEIWVEQRDVLRLTIEVSHYDPEVYRFWWAVLSRFMDEIVARVERDRELGLVADEVDSAACAEVLVLATWSVIYGRLWTGQRTIEETVGALTPIFVRALYPSA